MSDNAFFKPSMEYKKTRTITEFIGAEPIATEDLAEVKSIYTEVLDVAKQAGKMADVFAELAEKYYIPIGPDENEVRAAHRRTGGNGEAISFAEFRNAIDRQQMDHAETYVHRYNGFGRGDYRVLERMRMERFANRFFGPSGMSNVESFGNQELILWALNMLLGAQAAKQHMGIAGGKLPSGTETAEILQEIILAFLLYIYIRGLTEAAAESLIRMDHPDFSINGQRAMIQEVRESLLKNPSFVLFCGSMQNADDETLIYYCIQYIEKNGSEGYESWLAYLTSRHIEESCLRTYKAGESYVKGDTTLYPAQLELISYKTREFGKVLRVVLDNYGLVYGPGDLCCFIRFIWELPEELLEMLKNTLDAKLQIENALSKSVEKWMAMIEDIIKDPFGFIADQLFKIINSFFDAIYAQLAKIIQLNSDAPDIVKACLPVHLILEAIIDVLEEVKVWLKALIKSVGAQVEKFVMSNSESWTQKLKKKKHDKMREVIDKVAKEKANIGHLSEDNIARMVNDLAGKLIHPTLADIMPASAVALTEQIKNTCKTLGDWQKIKDSLGLDI